MHSLITTTSNKTQKNEMVSLFNFKNLKYCGCNYTDTNGIINMFKNMYLIPGPFLK
jgi:hypothetical protein